tara:strand:+ start:513 stop:812 length:300 start_codon:yes stop_codon:yes gene_type:complete
MRVDSITISEFKLKIKNESPLIIDIRDRQSYLDSNIPNSKNYDSYGIVNLDKNNIKEDIVVYCYRGNSSKKVVQFLNQNGFKNVYNLIGGFQAWQENLD